MRRRITSFLFCLFLFSVVIHLSEVRAEDPRTLTFPPVSFSPPRSERRELPNGMVLYLLEDHELPLITVHAMIRTGGIYDPPEKIGLAGIAGSVLRTGGTTTMSGDQIDEELEFIAAHVSTGIGSDAGSASLDVLRKDFEKGLSIFADILMNPVFAEEKVDLAKKQAIESIKRRNDSPSSVASREFYKLIYGPNYPYARESTIDTINQITRSGLIEFHKKYYHPNNLIIGIAGDFDPGEMAKKIEDTFSSWPRKEVFLPPVPPVKVQFRPSVNFIKKDLTQTYIRIGHLGIRWNNPDFFALSLLDDILGSGGFSSRLFREVRSQQGLAYAVGSSFSPGNYDLGVFFAFGETKGETTHKAISAIIENIKRIRQEPVSDEELRLAKDSFLNSFVFSFSSPSQIVSRQISLEYYDLPRDFLERFREQVANVTREDILRVARQYLHPEGLVILAVGREESFDRPLSTFGDVKVITLKNACCDEEGATSSGVPPRR